MSKPWTPERIATTRAVLADMREDVIGRKLPPPVYEDIVQFFKGVATEFVIFNESGAIWLTQRHSLKENPAEPYPSMWHACGVMHGRNETEDDAMERLFETEIGAAANLAQPIFVRNKDINAPPRGLYMGLIYISLFRSGTLKQDRPSGFYPIDALPEPLVPHHRDPIFPIAIAAARLQGWL